MREKGVNNWKICKADVPKTTVSNYTVTQQLTKIFPVVPYYTLILNNIFGCSIVPTSISVARCCAHHQAEKKVRPYFSNKPWSATLAASKTTDWPQVVHSSLQVLTQYSASVSAWRVYSSVIYIGSLQPPVSCSRRLMASAHKNKNIWPSCFCGVWTIHMEYIACNCSQSIIEIMNNSAVNWKVLRLIERIWLEQLRLRDNNLL